MSTNNYSPISKMPGQLGNWEKFKQGFNNTLNDLAGNPNSNGDITTGMFKGMSGGAVGLMSGLGATVGQLGNQLLSQGMSAGKASDATFGALNTVAGVLPGPLKGIATAGLGLLQGGINALFGSKINEENVNAVKNNINVLNAFQSNASNYDDLASNYMNAPSAMNFSNSYIGKDGALVNTVGDLADTLREEQRIGVQRSQNALNENAYNIQNNLNQNMLRNFSAFGGWVNSNSSDFTTGLTHINTGGSHEANPNQGVQIGIDPQGIPNLVEEGETIYNEYVYSKRLKVPKSLTKKYKLGKNISYADASKKLAKESEERPNDAISKRGLETIMAELAQSQEELKAKRERAKLQKQFDNMTPEEKYGIMALAQQQMQQQEDQAIQEQQIQQQMMQEQQMQQMPMEQFANGGNIKTTRANYFWPGGPVETPPELETYPYGSTATPPSKYSKWDSFKFSDTPLYNPTTGAYADIYTSNPFKDWLKSKEGSSFLQNWWTETNAPNYYSSNSAAPTIDALLGGNGVTGLMYDSKYSDAHTFGLAALQEYMKNKSIDTQYKLQNVDSDGKVTGVSDITDYFEGMNNNGQYYYGRDNSIYPNRSIVGTSFSAPDANGKVTKTVFFRDPAKKKTPNNYARIWDPKTGQYGEAMPLTDAVGKGLLEGLTRQHEVEEGDSNTGFYKAYEKPSFKKDGLANLKDIPVGIQAGVAATDLAGLTNKPDMAEANTLKEYSSNISNTSPVSFTPITNRLTYKPTDIDSTINSINSSSLSTARNLINTSAGNRGQAAANLLSNNYNNLIAIGKARQLAEQNNWERMRQVEDFNRGTNQTNSAGFLDAAKANQTAMLQGRQLGLEGLTKALELASNAKTTAAAARTGNLKGLLSSIQGIAENADNKNMTYDIAEKLGLSHYFNRGN